MSTYTVVSTEGTPAKTGRPDELLLWMDLETEGLYPHAPQNHRIFEIGAKVTDLDLNVLHDASFQIWYPGFDRAKCDPFIQDMHTKNGLFDDMYENGILLADAEQELGIMLEEWGIPQDRTMPMHGNSIRLDREFVTVWMPYLDQALSYRIVDVSTLKETCRRFQPELYVEYKATFPDDDKAHRVLNDIDHSIAEYRFYLEGMGWL